MARAIGAGENEKVRDLASRVGVSAEHATRTFRRHYGLTPCRMRAERRLRAALRALASGATSLAEAALECGYADQPHFTRELRRLTGHTPGRLRALLGRVA